MQSNFAVETHITGGVVRLALSGELDLVSTPALERAMDELTPEVELIIIDLRAVEFMDSTGLHGVLRAQQRAHDSSQRFALIRGGDQVQRLFELTGVAEGLTIVDSPGELVEAHGTSWRQAETET
ncbi:MAG: STAS domain-containing protein [Solirubrobacterales bacterium]|nr:STAS domain-containing protein [Solirubrobacterales bacterium]